MLLDLSLKWSTPLPWFSILNNMAIWALNYISNKHLVVSWPWAQHHETSTLLLFKHSKISASINLPWGGTRHKTLICLTESLKALLSFTEARPAVNPLLWKMKLFLTIYSLLTQMWPKAHTNLSLFDVGLNPQIPQKADGIRMLPPISVPKPRIDPPPPIRAPSPPDEPPGVFLRLQGFKVCP